MTSRLFAILALAILPARSEATMLQSMSVASDSDGVHVRLVADGPIRPRAQWLPQTNRFLLVVDLPGVDVRRVHAAPPFPRPLMHIGVSQWRSNPMTGRIALHVPAKRPWTIDTDANEAVISILDRDMEMRAASPSAPAARNDTTRRVSLLFRDADLTNVLRVIGEQNHLNVILPPDMHGSVTVFLENIPVEEALRKILFVHGYGFVLEDDVLLIVPGVNARENYTIYRPGADEAAALFRTLEKFVPSPGRLTFDEATHSIILYAPQPGMKPVFESIYNGLKAGALPSGT